MDTQYYPDVPAYQGGDTSHAAAKFMASKAPLLQSQVLRALSVRPMATFEIANAIKRSYRSVQPRTSELRLAGRIDDSGQRKIDPETERAVIVWQLTGDNHE